MDIDKRSLSLSLFKAYIQRIDFQGLLFPSSRYRILPENETELRNTEPAS